MFDLYIWIISGHYESHPNIMTFGVGKRSCLGESLARMEMLLFFTAIMQRYSVELNDLSAEEKAEMILGTNGGVHAPGSHMIKFKKRE